MDSHEAAFRSSLKDGLRECWHRRGSSQEPLFFIFWSCRFSVSSSIACIDQIKPLKSSSPPTGHSSRFLTAIHNYGVAEDYLFRNVDLCEGKKNRPQHDCIITTIPGFVVVSDHLSYAAVVFGCQGTTMWSIEHVFLSPYLFVVDLM